MSFFLPWPVPVRYVRDSSRAVNVAIVGISESRKNTLIRVDPPDFHLEKYDIELKARQVSLCHNM